MDLFGLNNLQRKIVEDGDGIFIINAGPGTGKTKTLTSRVAYLLLNKKVKPENILILTFTQRAALEMKERLQKFLGEDFSPIQVTTFHGFAFEKLREYGKEIKIIPPKEQEELIKKIIKNDGKKISFQDLSLMISLSKNSIFDKKDVYPLIAIYNKELSKMGYLDFDDLLLNFFKLLMKDEQIRKEFQEKYHYILIDEFQDTNNLQYQIIKLILNNNSNVFVIGDPLQSIYGFRGAGCKIFELIKNDFPGFREETLITSYRSDKHIVKVSNNVFPDGPKIETFSQKEGVVKLVTVLDEYREGEWIVRLINQIMGGTDFLEARGEVCEDINFSDFAIIYRTHGLARVLENILNKSGIPYQVVKEETNLEGDHIKLLSMHAAKGLEFKYVFICGFEEGLIPYKRLGREVDLEEEKRLLYVGMTRAKEGLFLISVKIRNKKETKISQFKKILQSPQLLEIEDDATVKILQKRAREKVKKGQISFF